MRWLDQLTLRLRTLFRRGRLESELHRELDFHLQEQTEENMARGMSRKEARYSALRTIGGMAQIEERCRDERGLQWIENTRQDVRYSLRSLRNSPGFTLVAVLSLTLGTGANMAIFSLIDSILLKSVPVKDPQQLVFVRTNRTKIGNFMVSRTLFNRDLEQMQKATQLQGIASYDSFDRANISSGGQTELRPAEFVSGTYFSVLGVPAQIGRTLMPADDTKTGSSGAAGWPAMISDGYWHRRFGGDPEVIGKAISINTIPFEIVGVMPRGFNGLSLEERPDVMMPLMAHDHVVAGSASAGFPAPDAPAGEMLARLKPDVPQRKAAAELTVIFHETESADRGLSASDKDKIAQRFIEFESAAQGSSVLRQRFSNPLRALMAAVGLVMLIACANIAALLLARAGARQKDFAVRLSLGASRRRLIRQLLTESLILSMLGCTLGIAFAVFARSATLKLGNGSAAGLTIAWDFRVLLFLAGVCVLNALLFGLVPALRATKVDPNEVLKSVQTTHSARLPFGRVLITAQLAISLVLVVGAALFLGTLRNLYQIDLGFNQNNLLVATLNPSLAGLNETRAHTVYRDLLDQLKQLPSVRSVTLMNNRLFTGRARLSNAKFFGFVPPSNQDLFSSFILTYGVGPHFFGTLEMPLVKGRDFTDADKEGAPRVAVINEALAKHYFPDKDPIGQKVSFGSDENTSEIVGVVANAHYFDVHDEKQETIFTPLLQAHGGEFDAEESVIARTSSDVTALANNLRAIVRRIDPNLPLFDITTMSEEVSNDLSTPRLMATLSTFFGLLALALSAIGLYGVLAYGVTRRTSEIGIRMALGSDRREILRLLLGETSQVVAIGIAIGLVAAWAASRLIKSMLYGLTGHDVGVFAMSALLLALVAALAAAMPARRAVNVDPMVALRYE